MWVVKITVPFLGTLNIRCRTIIGTQKGPIILTTTHMEPLYCLGFRISRCMLSPSDLRVGRAAQGRVGIIGFWIAGLFIIVSLHRGASLAL